LYDARSLSIKVDYTRPCNTDHSPRERTTRKYQLLAQ